MLAIKNNLMAETAARALGSSYDSLAKSVQRLSTGLRINSAKDDAAGMAVRELIRADIAVLKQGARNAQDAISMLQTSEGAMGVIDETLIRMSELAEQAATQSYSTAQRVIMNEEFDQLATEISRIATSTKFNGISLLNSTSAYNIHVGDMAEKIQITAKQMTRAALHLDSTTSAATDASIVNGKVGVQNATDVVLDMGAMSGTVTWSFEFTGSSSAEVVFQDSAYTLNAIIGKINAEAGATVASAYQDNGFYYLKIQAANAGALGGVTYAYADTGSASASFLDSTSAGAANTDWAFTNGTNSAGVAITIKSVASAEAALTALSSAIGAKDTYRAHLGYMTNRLEAAVSVIGVQTENLLNAESRISDVDVATEMATLTRTQVLTQAGISMLSQANSMPQMALKLLG